MAACGFSIALHNSIKIGPWGDKGAPNFDVHCLEIIEVIVYGEIVVNGLKITYFDDDGKTQIYKTGSLVGKPKKVELERGEYIKGVDGSCTNYDEQICIFNLVFKTNKLKTHGPFGCGCDKTAVASETFSVDVAGGKIVGFFGRSETYINSIGFYLGGTGNTASTASVVINQ